MVMIPQKLRESGPRRAPQRRQRQQRGYPDAAAAAAWRATHNAMFLNTPQQHCYRFKPNGLHELNWTLKKHKASNTIMRAQNYMPDAKMSRTPRGTS